MKVKRHVGWVSKDKISVEPSNWTILGHTQQEQDGMMDNRLKLSNPELGQGFMSFWGENWNKLIDKFGDDSDLWTGKVIALRKEVRATDGKEIIVIV